MEDVHSTNKDPIKKMNEEELASQQEKPKYFQKDELAGQTRLTSVLPLPSLLTSLLTPRDLNLRCQDGSILSAHSLVVAAAAPLVSDACSSLQPEDTVLLMPDWDSAVVQLLLDYIYTGKGAATCKEEKDELVKLVDALGVGRKRELNPNIMANIVIVKAEPSNLLLEEEEELDGTEEMDEIEDSCKHFLEESDEEETKHNNKRKIPLKVAKIQDNMDCLNFKHVYDKVIKVKHEIEDSVKEDDTELKEDHIEQTKCSHCPKTFTRQKKLEEHEVKHTGKKLKCQHCPKVFDRPGLRRVHEQLHTKPFKCTECDAGFGRKSNLIGHQRIHRGERPFICDLCGRGFPIQSSLLTHKKQSHPEGSKPWDCEYCEHRFVSKSQLEIHTRVHTKEKPWICDTCGRGFTTKQNMLDHTRLHNDKMDFCCIKCGQQFKWKQSLERHLMDHTGVRPHPCEECKLTFKTSNSLKKHKLSVHSDIKHFACQFCGSRFSTSSGVLRHQKKQRCSVLRPGEEPPGGNDEDKIISIVNHPRGGRGATLLQPEATLSLVKQEGEAWRALALSREEAEGAHFRLHLPLQ